ncbi:bifunctional serine/threonine-protein kinase/formylglycine-generating enzyme family protein [Azospirillum sp. B2RO_4]|uniref:bifunctional serine/threonine-protein kinase/formylglycine-generating enzyme family protein n=1 Tax=Azospirillum sp. B2RO_4 TaxID=3027796 RepID=UPI003DA7DE5B
MMNDTDDFGLAIASGAVQPRGRYENWRRLGRGGTATVYRVFDAELNYDVAIKVLNPDVLADSSLRDTMLRSIRSEVLISRLLRHENICPIHDIYDGPRGFGVVMDIVDGVELRQWMDANRNGLRDTATDRLELLKHLTGALAVAHTRIVHRDLKPQNIFLRGGDIGRPVIMDFGFSVLGAKVAGDFLEAYTPKYMAPEQFEAPETVDRRADLWALGIIAYELFTGRVPPNSLQNLLSTGQVPRIAIEHIDPPSRYNAAVPPALDRLILQLMAYRPERRIQAAEELLDALRVVELLSEPGDGGRERTGRRDHAVLICGGEHHLGTRAGVGVLPNELPGRRIRLSPFLIDPRPVTVADFAEFVTATGHPAPPLLDKRLASAASHPVVAVTHADAQAYARWVGGFLPTEAQWECAARGGVPFADYPWGSEPPGPTRANIGRASTMTSPVGSYAEGRNPYGLDDLCGNVWEWCQDVYDDAFYRTLTKDAPDPVNSRGSGPRVLRGGSFESVPVQGRCAFRSSAPPGERRGDVGFRVAYLPDL